tara:strand:- start:7 stop:309 length:303 start_codon:yes stop_codon:yes gene_type:complete
MKQSINEYQFRDAFHKMGRGKQFSYNGLKALYDYLEQLEDEIGEEIELDVIALCCEYAEYKSLEHFQNYYGEDYQTIEDIRISYNSIMIDDESFIISQYS